MSKWINITRQQPDHQQKILITDGTMVTAAEYWVWPQADKKFGLCPFRCLGFDGYEWEWDFNPKDITHWMPLPNPPVKGKK